MLQKHKTETEDIFYCNNEEEKDEEEKDEEEKPIEAKVAERLAYSNYLVCPIRYSYRKMFDTTSITFAALYNWVQLSFPEQRRSKAQQRLLQNLGPNTKSEDSNGFILGRDKGNIEEYYFKAKLSLLGDELHELRRTKITDGSALLL